MKKQFRHLLGLVLSLFMILSLIPVTGPSRVYAAKQKPYSHAYIEFRYGSNYAFVIDRDGKYKEKPPKGVSYNESTNTMTWNNVSLPYWDVEIQGMGDLTIELKGNNKVRKIMCWYGSGSQKVSLTFSGKGKLTMNSKYNGSQVYGNIYVGGTNAKLTIGKNVAMDIKGTTDSPPLKILKREATGPGNPGSYLSISGAHSSGSLKWNGGIYEQYEWNKAHFTKGKQSSSSSMAPAVPSQIKNPKGSSSNKKATFTWTKLTKNCTGYQVQLSYSKKFTSPTKKTVKGKTNAKTTFSKLKAGKYVYFRVRAYNTKNQKTKYGSWSKTVKLKVKSASSANTSKNSSGVTATSSKKGYAVFKWPKATKTISAYETQLSYEKSFNNTSQKIVFYPNSPTTSWDNLTSGKTVYFRVRTYYMNGGTTTYSAWSKVISIKVK